MATHADVAAKLLEDAASFFRALAEDNAEIRDQMINNAETYEYVAELVASDPTGVVDMGEPTQQ